MTVTNRKRKFEEDVEDDSSFVADFGEKYLNINKRYHCDSCSKDITYLAILRCAECQDFDLCVECFRNGVEINNHKADHKYRVIDALDFPIFERNWGADEELLLVEGLELFGIGNWEQISEHIGTKVDNHSDLLCRTR